MKRFCTVCDNCLGDDIITLATHVYDSSIRRQIHVCDDCADMVRRTHEQYPDEISEPIPASLNEA